MELPVSVKLSSIYCHDEADGPGNAEPYLWTIFFKIDGETITQNGIRLNGEAVFAFGPGSHYNLRTEAVVDGESLTIPPAIGEWSTTLRPLVLSTPTGTEYRIPGILGVAAVLMEEDNVSDSGAEAGHQALNRFVRDSINQFLADINLLDFIDADDPEAQLAEKIEALKKKLIDESGSRVRDAITSKQPWYNDAWAWVNADDKIGSEIWMFDQNEIVSRRYHIHLNKRWKSEGDWEIHGDVNAPNPCQAQLNAVNRQRAVIKGIEDTIRALQAEMRTAPPAMKAGLRAEIEEVRREQLAPAKAALEPLLSAVETCYLRQRFRVDLGAGTGTVLTGG